SRYIDDGRVQQLEKCSVAFLMGCKSGSLTLQGSESLLKDMLEPTNEIDIGRIGAFVSKARDKCIRPFISGASLVCYGVPVGIKRLETHEGCD
ncbi:hypothetical protein A2U01_0024891, partial [Trifolium medium]|nr:hypothetical protein [Trifolium medium]